MRLTVNNQSLGDISQTKTVVEYSQIKGLHDRVGDSVIMLSDEKEYLAGIVDFVDTRVKQHQEIEQAQIKIEQSVYVALV